MGRTASGTFPLSIKIGKYHFAYDGYAKGKSNIPALKKKGERLKKQGKIYAYRIRESNISKNMYGLFVRYYK